MSAPINITEVQTAAQTAIAAAAYFTGRTVLLDNGKIQQQEEDALQDVGECVVVGPLLDGDLTGQGSGAGLLRVGLAVHYEVNPKLSETNVLEMYQKGTAALLAYSVDDKRNNFSLAQAAFVISVDDQGLRVYTAFYEKLAALRHTD